MNNQNESPFGNPKFVISIIVVFVFLWGWQYYVNKNYPQPATSATKTENTTIPQDLGVVKKAEPTKTETTSKKSIEKAISAVNETKHSYEDEAVKWTLSSYGMGLDSVTLKTYFNEHKEPVNFNPTQKLFSVNVDGVVPQFKIEKISEIEFLGIATINGKNIKRKITYNKSNHSFESNLEFDSGIGTVGFSTTETKAQHESSFLMPSFKVQNFLYKDSEKVKTEDISHLKDTDALNKSAINVSLASIGSQYFTQSFLDKSDILPSINMAVVGKEAKLDVLYNLKNSQISQLKSVVFIGPKSTETLKKIDPILPEVLDLGMFGFIAKPLLVLMKFMFSIFGNWGVAIIALTIVMRFLMLPFNMVSFKSAQAMQKIQPQLAAIREKYKNDPMAVNRETMALMKQHNANPLSSCLPMLIQIPIFFALWRTIGTSIEIYQQPFFGWITDLSSHDKFFVLPVLMGITMYFQQKMTPTTMDPTQAKILNFMPILFSLFMISLPSGLTLYNFISSLFGVAQQYFLLRGTKQQN